MSGFMRVRRLSLVSALALVVVAAPGTAFAGVPQGPNVTEVVQDCAGSPSLTLFLHPGLGKALWDITTVDVTSGPNSLIKSIDQQVFLNDQFVGTFHYSFGNKVGLGDPVVCTYHEHFTTPDGVVDVFGTSYHVLI